MPHYHWLIVGAGFTGAVLAERIASQLDQRVLLIDRRAHVGGNAYDHYDEAGVLVHAYGPHIFHTNAPRIRDYLSQFTAWRPYEHRVRAMIGGQLVPVPANFRTLELLFGVREGARIAKTLCDEFGLGAKTPILKLRESRDPAIRKAADALYEKIFLHYSTKQWGHAPDALDPSVTARVPVHLSDDDRYFQDSFQKMPAEGFGALFARMLDHRNIETHLGVAHDALPRDISFDRMIYTGPIDAFFDDLHGPLPYRSLTFAFESSEEALIQPCGQVNFTEADVPYTRVTEFRHLTGQSHTHTTRAREYPTEHVRGENEPYYPIPRAENAAIYARYRAEADKLKSVIFAGRLADYRYYNMDQAVGAALAVFEKQITVS